MPDAAAYLLLLVDVLVVAAVISLLILAVWWVLARLLSLRRSSDGGRGRTPAAPSTVPSADPTAARSDEPVLRRCDACGVAWKGRPGDDASVVIVRLRRWKRRRTRERKQDTPPWARRRGWQRCPSCLSTDVRTSSRQNSRR